MLTIMALIVGGWGSVSTAHVMPMVLSGLIGIFIGDTALFACMNRMGPRQAGLLFSCHAVFSAILGYWLFSETWHLARLSVQLWYFLGWSLPSFLGAKAQITTTGKPCMASLLSG
ncbi:permease [Vibrio ishigakensis]|uniref:Permease n=1 Tax=Vibrio ishigakensis TaxID=1481914 RepID=A0A0B8QVT1_9VIBR|nr:permease [Vibrio ishigakensis]